MNITVKNYKEILSIYISNGIGLSDDDYLMFQVNDACLCYKNIDNLYLYNVSGSNSAIFRALNLDKKKCSEKIYGHAFITGDFPEYRGDDLTMMCKIAYFLFEECVAHTIPVKEISLNSIGKKSFLDEIEEDVPTFTSLKFDDILIPEINVAVRPRRAEPVGLPRRDDDFNIRVELPW